MIFSVLAKAENLRGFQISKKNVCMLEIQPQRITCKPSKHDGKGSGEGHMAVSGLVLVVFCCRKVFQFVFCTQK